MKELEFLVQGNEEKQYITKFCFKNNNTVSKVSCTCPSWTHTGKICKHIIGIFAGDIDNLISHNHDDLIDIFETMNHTDLSSLYYDRYKNESYSFMKKDAADEIRVLIMRQLTNNPDLSFLDLERERLTQRMKILLNNDNLNSKKRSLDIELDHFASGDGMEIVGGAKTIENLIELGYLKKITDYYNLYTHKDKLITHKYFGEKIVSNILDSIEKSKEKDLPNLIYALGIPHIGKYHADLLANKYKNLEVIEKLSSTPIKLMQTKGIGEEVAFSIYEYFQRKENKEKINELKRVGVNIIKKEIDKSNFLKTFRGKTFLVTGKLSFYNRREIKLLIEKLGGTNATTVNNKLDYLIVGEKAGSKLEKAKQIGTVTVLKEEDFFKIIEENK